MTDTHRIIERDVAIIEVALEYDSEAEMLKHVETSVGDSLSSYDSEFRCTCGVDLDDFEAAREHAAQHS